MTGRAKTGRSWRWIATLAVVAVVGAGCAPGFGGGGFGPRSRVHILAPANRSQAPTSGAVPVDITLDAPLDPSTVRVQVIPGGLFPTGAPVDVTSRLSVQGREVTGTLEASDLREGLDTIVASAKRSRRSGQTNVARSVISWEPQVDFTAASRCDVIDPKQCELPFPDDFFTVRDPSTVTGRRVNFDPASMPVNSSGQAIVPTEWNRNDGFSPGSMIVTYVPGLDLARTGAAPITDIGESLDPNQPIVLLDATTGKRVPFWAEMDAQADPTEGAALIIRPAVNFVEGHRIVVALRNLKDASGATLPAGRAFTLYRDGVPTFDAAFEARRPRMDRVLFDLAFDRVSPRSLYLAWDFTVASARSLAGRMLHIRDDAFASLNGAAPSFQVASVQANPNSYTARRVTGTFEVPNYLTGDGGPGNQFDYASANPGPYDVPQRNGTWTANFVCDIPTNLVAADGSVKRIAGVVYGHGLLGSADEVNSDADSGFGNTYGYLYCATDWIGFSENDVGVAVSALSNLTNFQKLADRTQQGMLDFLFLGRLLHDPRGFASDPAFAMGAANTPVLDGDVYYDGNSQGGIIGGAVTAVSTEWTKAVLGVPGMNYSTLLQRSVDFNTYAAILVPSYPSEMTRLVGYSFLQILWDRAEADGYAEHMTHDPYPGTPNHTVLMQAAFGDHQVANVAADVEARTIGAHLLEPPVAPGRSPDVVPEWGIPAIPSYPWFGSAYTMWDSGTPPAPLANVPPNGAQYGRDPHEDPRRAPDAQEMKSLFLRPGGAVYDTCGGAACTAPPTS